MIIRNLIGSAFRTIQMYAPGEEIENVDLAAGFELLNQLLDLWSNENLMCFAVLQQVLNLRPTVYQYTLGPGGDLEFRPLSLKFGPGNAFVLDNNGNRYAVEVITKEQWNSIGNISNTNSNFPDRIYFDPQFPLGILYVYPVPNIAYPLYFDSVQQLTEFESIDVDVNLPRGYSEALRLNLAVRLKSQFPAAILDDDTRGMAIEAKAVIKRTNMQVLNAVYDADIIARAKNTYNIYTDNYNSSRWSQ